MRGSFFRSHITPGELSCPNPCKSVYQCICDQRVTYGSLMAAWIVLTVGTFASLPDSSMNILHENPIVSWGCSSFPLIKTDGEPVTPRAMAWLSSIR